MSTTTTSLNQVNLRAVGALIEQIRAEPGAAHTEWRSRVSWRGGFRSDSQSRSQAPVPSDEPEALGGGDSAPNPVEQLLGAFGNCLAVGYAANATATGIRIDALEIELSGSIDLHTFLGLSAGNAGFEAIQVKVHLQSPASPEAIAKLHAKVVNTSPVGHTLGRAVPLSIELAR